MNSSPIALITAALAFLLFIGHNIETASAAPSPPPNFVVEDVLTQLEQPMSIRFLPDGRMLLLEKKGKIRIVDVLSATTQQAVYLDLASPSHADGIDYDQERGLIDIAIDPAFPAQPYIYLFYTPVTGINGAKARIARFTHVQNSGGVSSRGDVTSEVMIWEDTQGYDSCCHFGGGLDFGPDGNLWLTTGDHFQGSYAASVQRAGGSVVRVTKNGSIPAGNPYIDGSGPNVDSLFAIGLRNPFRARWDIPSGRLFIAEVGGNTQSVAWEDLHVIRFDQGSGRFVDSDFGTTNDNGVFDGINFGWPMCEGQPPYTNFPGCNIERAGQPLFAYPHSGNTAAINGGVVYRATQFPAQFQGAYFYADSTRDFIRYLKFNPDGSIAPNPNPAPLSLKNPEQISYPFDLSPLGRIVSLEVGPDGALYYVSFTDSGGAYGEPNPSVLGAVRRYVYSAGNAAPKIDQFAAEPLAGGAPLNVEFTFTASDSDSPALSYFFDFGDGASVGPFTLTPGATVSMSHTYLDDGVHTAQVEVSDGSLISRASLDVRVGNAPAISSMGVANNRAGAISNFFRFGDTLTFSASALDAEDGAMVGSNFTWSVDFIRPGNIHPVVAPVSGATAVEFSIPAQGQGFSGPVFYRCYLTVTDSSGLTTSTNIDVFPEKVNVAFNSVPSGILVQVDGNTAQTTPFVLDSLVNLTHIITVPTAQCVNGTNFQFTNWSNGALTPSQSFNVPETNSVLTASYIGNGACTNNLLVTSGLVFHVEADLNVALQSGNIVAGWLDQSGWGNDLVAGGQPTFLPNATPSGAPAVRFDGIDDKLERIHTSAALGGLPTGNANRTMFLVARYHQSGAWGGAGYGNSAGNQAFALVVRHPVGELTLQGWGSGNDLVSTSPGIGAGWLVQSATLTNGNATLYRDGVQIAQWLKAYNTVLNRIIIGQEIAGLGYMRMDVAAVLIYNRALTSAERSQVDAYLREKYFSSPAPTNQPPTLAITTPANGTVFTNGQPVTFSGTATDAEDDDAILSASIVWSSDKNGVLGTNRQLTVTNLSTGSHLITAFVRDSQGAEATASVQLSIQAAPTGGGNLLTNNLVLHLESTQGVTASGGQVTSWADSSSRSNHVFGVSSPTLIPAGTPAGHPAIRCDGTDRLERLHSTSPLNGLPLGNTNRTMFFVAKYSSSTAWGGAAYGNGAGNQTFGLVVRHPTGELVLQGWGSGQDLVSTNVGLGAGWLIQSGVLQGGNATLYANGTQIAQWNHTYGTVANKLVIGQEIAGLGNVGVDVAAVLIYDRALTAAERNHVEAYLREKYIGSAAPPNQPPSVTITSPTNGAVFTNGQPVTLIGTATDAEDDDTILSASIVWSSHTNGVLGTNQQLTVTNLSVGNHLITAFVRDSQGGEATATVQLSIQPAPTGGGNLLTNNLVLHLESTQGVTASGGQVTSWADFSPRNNHVFGIGSPTLVPAATPTGHPAIRCDGTDRLERLHSTSPLNGLPAGNINRTMFFVAKYNSSTAWAGAAYGNGAGNQAFGLVVRHPSGELVLQGWGNGQDLISTNAGLGAGWLVQSGVLQGGNATLYANGIQIAQWNHTYGTVANKLVIGQEIAGLGNVGVDVAALLIYDRSLTVLERNQVEAYLREKYISAPTPTNQPPTVTITTPASGSVYTNGQQISFTGAASDPEQGNLSSSIVWTSSIGGALGIGASITTNLAVGTHTITASVSDNGNLTRATNITVTVSAPSGGNAITPTGTIQLFNGQSLAGLYPWFSNSGFSDPTQIFQVTNGLLHVSGNGWGALITSNRYRDYTMILEFKWGTRTWGGRQNAAKDGGILFHSTGVEGGWGGFLMPGLQAQIMEGSIGDLLLMRDSAGNIPMTMTAISDQVPDIGQSWNYRGGHRWNTNGIARTFSQDLHTVHWSGWDPAWKDVLGYRGSIDIESPDGQWNQMIIVAENNQAKIYLNGIQINEVSNLTPSEGKLQLEVEFAEFTVRKWELRPNGQPFGPMIVSDRLPRGTAGQNYGYTLRVVGGAAPYTWSITNGSLPTGLTLNSATGVISGQPAQAGVASCVITVTDNSGSNAFAPFSVTISNPGSLVTTGLVVRLESDANVTLQSGNIIGGWGDQSGLGNNLTAFGSPRYGDVQTPSGLPAVSLNGAGDKLQRLHSSAPLTGLPAGNTNRSIIVVKKYNALTGWAGVAYGTGTGNQAFGLIASQTTGNLVLHGWGSGNDLISAAPGLGAGWLVHSGVLNNGVAAHYLEGTSIGQFSHNYNTVLTKLVVGEETAGFGYADMDVAAVLIYNRALTSNELRDVEDYLISKYLVAQP